MSGKPQSPTRGDAIDPAIMGVDLGDPGGDKAAISVTATGSIDNANRRIRLAGLVLKCDPAMLTAIEGIMGMRGPGE